MRTPVLSLAFFLVGPVLGSQPVLAGPVTAVDRAEAERLSVELRDRVADVRWDAADAAYRRLVALPGDLGSFEDHWRGVQTARARGDVTAAWARLQAASDRRPTDPALLGVEAQLLAWYGPVDLRVGRKVDDGVQLRLDPMPVDPVQRRVFEAAAEQLGAEGSYQGLLPLGMYVLGGTRFEVVGAEQPVKVRVR